MHQIKVIGFDADDTLWANGSYFREVEVEFCRLLTPYLGEKDLAAELYRTEMKNMEWYGYGAMAFTLSLIETALRVSDNQVPGAVVSKLLKLGRSILSKPIELFPGIPEILPPLRDRFQLVVVTKGDMLDQKRKLEKSGLLPFFHHIEIVTEKEEKNYRHLIYKMNIRPDEFLMVGNSLKSDILPVLAIGAHAVHVPFDEVWQHEHAAKPDTPYIELPSLLELPELLLR